MKLYGGAHVDTIKMGQFISELRKSHQMTQRDLAERLNVTDKSVSKWERGLSCPDISLLTPLSDILGVSVSDLLNGSRSKAEVTDAEKTGTEASITYALRYADKSSKDKIQLIQTIGTIVFSGLILIGIVVCAIIDLAISGTFTWALIPISACVFTWLIVIPAIRYGTKGIGVSLILLSVLIVPFLFVLSSLISTDGLLMTIGVRMALISIVYLWSVFAVFKVLRSRVLIAAAVSLLLTIPCTLAINFTLSRIVSTPLFDAWSALATGIVTLLATALFVVDLVMRRKERRLEEVA